MSCKKDCCRNKMDDSLISAAIHEKNAAVVGSAHAPAVTNNRHLPGIDPDRPFTYVPVFFGATREYGPNEGWQTVSYRKKGRKARRWLGKEVEEVHEEENYE